MIRVLALDPGWTTTTQAEHESLKLLVGEHEWRQYESWPEDEP